MKQGFNGTEVYNMYRSLAKETFNYFGYDLPWPKFKFEDCLDTGRNWWLHDHDSMAFTNFRSPDKDPYSYFNPRTDFADHATAIVFCSRFCNLMFEDELIGVILHELGHVVTVPRIREKVRNGFSSLDYHGRIFTDAVSEIGGYSGNGFTIRNFEKLPVENRNGLFGPEVNIWMAYEKLTPIKGE